MRDEDRITPLEVLLVGLGIACAILCIAGVV